MAEPQTMIWHAQGKANNKYVIRQLILGIAIPILIIAVIFGLIGMYYQGFLSGLKGFGAMSAIGLGFFGLVFLITLPFVALRGFRMAFIMNETGIYHYTDDQTVQMVIGLGSGLVSSTDPVRGAAMGLSATASAKAARKIEWRKIDSIIENPDKNSIFLRRGRRVFSAVYTNDSNYADVRSFIQQHIAKAKEAARN